MHKATAIILCKNEAPNIAAAIESVLWADEVLVVDSYSTDETLEIAAKFPVKILQRPFDTHARQKNWALEQAAHNWIFILDADERVPQELKQEITTLLKSNPEKAAYWIYRRNFFMGREVKYSNWQKDKVIRLFDKTVCKYQDKQVHEEIETSAPIGFLKHKLLHYTYRDLKQYLAKWDHYTWLSAKDHAAKTGDVTLFHLWLKPAFSFFKHYILKGGILDGKVGFIISYMAATTVFMRYLKLWRMREDTINTEK